MNNFRNRIKAIAQDDRENWFRIVNKKGDDNARVDLYDEIGLWGTTAGDFVTQLRDISAKQIDLHINSPGGEVWDGVAIFNALRDHDAKIVVTVDSIAASAASLIAMAGDEIIMNSHSEMMIHDAWGLCMGNAGDMKFMAERLDKMSDNIASAYANRAGGEVKDWRKAMRDESWYSAEEAVEAGLADRVAENKDDSDNAKNEFNLSVFMHAGRRAAPKPKFVNTAKRQMDDDGFRISLNEDEKSAVFDNNAEPDPDTFSTNKQEDQLTAEQLEKLGLPEDATQEQIDARLEELTAAEAAAAESEKTDDPKPDVEVQPDVPAATPEVDPAPGTEATPSPAPEGTVLVDKQALDDLKASAARADKLWEEKRVNERDALLNSAMQAGKFGRASRDQFARLYDIDPKGTTDTINALADNIVPVREIGHGGSNEGAQDSAQESYPTQFLTPQERAQIAKTQGA